MAFTRHAELVAAAALVLATTSVAAREIFLDQREVTRHNLRATAEALTHHDKPVLSIRIDATELRDVPLANGGHDLERVVEDGSGPAFLPVVVSCERMRLEHDGRTYTPHADSLCAEPAKLPGARSMPIFVAFPLPPGEKVRQARLVIPVTVLRPEPAVQKALRETGRQAPQVDEARLGAQVLTATVNLR